MTHVRLNLGRHNFAKNNKITMTIIGQPSVVESSKN